MPSSRAATLLERHVALFNEGVRRADFAPMMQHFAPDAELAFDGIPVGPFRGRDAIAEAYRQQPPDDQISIVDVRESDTEVVAGYAWSREPRVRAGELRLTHDGGQIHRLVVSFHAREAAA